MTMAMIAIASGIIHRDRRGPKYIYYVPNNDLVVRRPHIALIISSMVHELRFDAILLYN